MKFSFCKRMVAFVLSVCICCLVAAPVFATETEETAEVSLLVNRDGDTITATVELVSIHTEIAGCDFYLNFDNSKLEYLEHTSHAFDFGFRDKVDYLYFSGFANNGVSEPGTLAVVTFKVLDTASGNADISLSDVILGDQEAQQVPVAILTTVESADNSVTTSPEKEGVVIVDLGVGTESEHTGEVTGTDGETSEQVSDSYNSESQEQKPTAGKEENAEQQKLDGIQEKKSLLFWLLPVGLLLVSAVIVAVLVAGKKKK